MRNVSIPTHPPKSVQGLCNQRTKTPRNKSKTEDTLKIRGILTPVWFFSPAPPYPSGNHKVPCLKAVPPQPFKPYLMLARIPVLYMHLHPCRSPFPLPYSSTKLLRSFTSPTPSFYCRLLTTAAQRFFTSLARDKVFSLEPSSPKTPPRPHPILAPPASLP